MLNLIVNGKYTYYAVYFEKDYDDDTIQRIYENKIYPKQNDATLITDIQFRTNRSRLKRTKLIDIDFDYIYRFNNSSEELKKIQKQQLIDIFTNMRFVKICEESLPELDAVRAESMLANFPFSIREEMELKAAKNTENYIKILNILKEEKIIDKDIHGITEQDIKYGNLDDLYLFLSENYKKSKIKLKGPKKFKKNICQSYKN